MGGIRNARHCYQLSRYHDYFAFRADTLGTHPGSADARQNPYGPPGAAGTAFLLDGNAETALVRTFDVVPDYMKAHPDGPAVWQMVCVSCGTRLQILPTLVDYWPGNMLWDHGGPVTAVLMGRSCLRRSGHRCGLLSHGVFLSGHGYVADEFLTYGGNGAASRQLGIVRTGRRRPFAPWGDYGITCTTFRAFIAHARTAELGTDGDSITR